jgi:hypothetical protein
MVEKFVSALPNIPLEISPPFYVCLSFNFLIVRLREKLEQKFVCPEVKGEKNPASFVGVGFIRPGFFADLTLAIFRLSYSVLMPI